MNFGSDDGDKEADPMPKKLRIELDKISYQISCLWEELEGRDLKFTYLIKNF